MSQEKKKPTIYQIVTGVLSFFRSEIITNDKLAISRAFCALKIDGFGLLQDIMFGNDNESREIEEIFSRFLTTGLVRYGEWGSGTYHLYKEVLIELRRELPKDFTAEEIIQLSEIAEELEKMIAIRT